MVKVPGILKLILIPLTYGAFLLVTDCNRPSISNENKLVPVGGNDQQPVNNTDYINFRSFQNPDKTWGFTIFINSMPFRHYSEIPYKGSSTGFLSREEAEDVANLFVGMIRNGDQSPRLSKKLADSLEITINKRKMHSQ